MSTSFSAVNRPKQALDFIVELIGDKDLLQRYGVRQNEECYEIATVVVRRYVLYIQKNVSFDSQSRRSGTTCILINILVEHK